MEEKFDTYNTDLPICPRCGFENTDWWDGTKLERDGDSEIVECLNCDKKYKITMNIETSFITEAQ